MQEEPENQTYKSGKGKRGICIVWKNIPELTFLTPLSPTCRARTKSVLCSAPTKPKRKPKRVRI